MSKRRSDWQSRPQARISKWFQEGFLALDEEIIDQITEESQTHPSYEALLEAQNEANENRKHERTIALDRMDQYNVLSWARTRGRKVLSWLHVLLALVLSSMMIFFLLETVALMPRFGDAQAPGVNEVSQRYISKGLEETGAVNMVAGMILDYRAFDTLGESTVLFIAACAVLILLRIDRNEDGSPVQELIAAESDDRFYEPGDDLILQGSAKILTPIILLFGIYIILNGHLSPGGGFSGGAIVSAGLILYLDAFGFEKAGRFFTNKTFVMVSFFSLSFYAIAKTYSFYCGANGLVSGIPLGTPGAILSSGLILPLNIAVGLVVACTMYIFYALFRKGGL
jgi:multicomponent Na+:H+ antiporter subunit B